MSQIFKTAGSNPIIATSYVCDTGSAVPAANILNVLGSTGLTTTGSGNTITITNTSGNEATGQTVGAVTTDITAFNMGSTAGTYSYDMNVAGYCTAGTDAGNGCGAFVRGTFRTDGATTTEIGVENFGQWADAALAGVTIVANANANTVRVQVTGVAGDTINWKVLIRGTFVS